ncbi:hypothetical protein [Actinokineospora sp. NPDC004072]
MTQWFDLVQAAGNLLALVTALTNLMTTVRNRRVVASERPMEEDQH